MTDFRFATPDWIHTTWIVLLIAALLVVLELRGQSVLDQFVSKFMQSRLVHRISIVRRLVTIAFVTLSMLLLVITLMQPQWGRTVQNVARVESQMMICLDVSKSMLAEDVAPSRLERAKVELDSLLGLMDDGQQVGLIGFAGKATVMCPLTTDFGFLRLILREARPDSVGLGGTKIGEAIRKAVNGFGEAGDINRLIMVLTDGEDHDSFPLEVAATAREKGIKIISIGFGDEAGSKIEITDPESGARSFVKDRNGNDVISRLDGETLRDIAMETEGAYIPAGTGALDLESIYDAHIKTLLSGSNQSDERVIRNEAFQWPLLGAIATMLFALFVSTPFRLRELAAEASQDLSLGGKAALVFIVTGIAFSISPAHAQQPSKTPAEQSLPQESDVRDNEATSLDQGSDTDSPNAALDTPDEDSLSKIPDEIDPRDAYNQSLAFVSSDPDRAEQYLNRARRDAGVDGEVRFRSLYNLGWVEVNRADKQLEKEPEQALGHLQQAANRFREAIRVRPESEEARHNLEIVSRRILELADSLNKKDPRDLAARLDELIQQIRDHQSQIRNMAQSSSIQINSGNAADLRRPFRQLGVAQRQIISDVQRFSDEARQELDGIQVKKPDELTDEEKIKTVQIGNMLVYLESGLQRMNKARSLTRRLQAVRGFQRWSAALSDAKRARDQLRNPVEIIGQLIGDAAELNQLTRVFDRAKSNLLSDENANENAPVWLTSEYLAETQEAIEQRTTELNHVLAQAVAAQAATGEEDANADAVQNQAEAQQLMENIRECLPFMEAAATEFGAANEKINEASIAKAIENQVTAIKNLNEAWELFFEIRRLIEITFRDENIINSGIEAAKAQPAVTSQIVEATLQPQQKNLARCDRLANMLETELAKTNQPVATEAPNPNGDPSNDAAQQAAEKQRLELAQTILKQIVVHLNSADESLKQISQREPVDTGEETDESAPDETAEASETEDPIAKDPELESASLQTEEAIKKLEELRRLFFSLIEHLRDTAQRQSNLNDETQEQFDQIEPDSESELAQQLGPFTARQEQLKSVSDQIAKALAEQAEQAANAADQQRPAGGQPPDPQDAAQAAEKLREASQFVDAAANEMDSAKNQLTEIMDSSSEPASEPDQDSKKLESQSKDSAMELQQKALENLLNALELLDQNQNQDQQGQQNQDQQQDQSEQNEQEQRQQQQQMNAQQLLQMIRDREAERRKDKQQRAVGAGNVDKDW